MKLKLVLESDNSVEKVPYVCPSSEIYVMELQGMIAGSGGDQSTLEDMPEEDW